MSTKKIISKEQIIAAIDQGLTIEIDLASITDEAERDEFSALLAIAKVSASIKQKQNTFLKDAIKAGDHWAHLIIKEKIGSGGFGQVFRAFDTVLQAEVAVKFLNPESQLQIQQDDFLQEARLMATVRNPHVLAIHGAATDNGVAGYWSDYLDGEVLFERLQQGTLAHEQQIQIIGQLIQAVKATHDSGVVHGDIKSLNVMLQPSRGAILLDFGSSRSGVRVIEGGSTIQASPIAMAPEQFAGEVSSQASDVFTLGLLIVEILTGHHLLMNKDLNEIRASIVNLPKALNKLSLRREWRQLLAEMLLADPNRRPGIDEVDKQFRQIKINPVKRVKRIAVSVTMLFLISVIVLSFYNNWSIRQANKQTDAINNVLSDILLKSSPLDDGKDVLLVDVLGQAQVALIENDEISDNQKIKSLLQLLQTYRLHSKLPEAQELASQLLSDFNLTNSEKLDLLVQKADMANRSRKFAESEPLYLEALTLKPNDKNDADVLVLAAIGLIKNYIDNLRLAEVPPLISQAKEIWEKSNKNQSSIGLIHQIEGNFYEIKKQFGKAFELYQKAAANFESFYGKRNINVLIAMGNAATVLGLGDDTRKKGIKLQEQVVSEMTALLGGDHTSALIARLNLSNLYTLSGQPKKGLETILPYMSHVYKKFGEEGAMTLAFEDIVAEFYQADGNLKKADELLSKVVSVMNKTHGMDSEQALKSRLKRVLFLHQTEQLQSASDELKLLSEIAQQAHQSDSRISLDIEEYQIWNQYLLGSGDAINDLQQLAELKLQKFGEHDPSTVSAFEKLNTMESGSSKTD